MECAPTSYTSTKNNCATMGYGMECGMEYGMECGVEYGMECGMEWNGMGVWNGNVVWSME